MQQQKSSPATSIFCAAAPSDTNFLVLWERHLLPLMQAGRITIWSELHLVAGTPRTGLLHEHLNQAHVIVFLLSPDFFASNECMVLMEQALSGHARVIPLLLGPVDWKTSRLANLMCMPANSQFVTAWDNLDQALHTCVDDLRQLLGLPVVQTKTRKSAHTSTLQSQNRERMLRRLRHSYQDLMSQSLQGVAWLELGITSKPDAVQNAVNLLLRVSNRPEERLAPGTSITQAYDGAEHELLILGEPGAGKSTLLLDLAQCLVERAEADETHPLPVILPLSSWATKRPTLQDWIAEQLAEIYDVPKNLSRQWVREGHILPLLDGLDEMEETARPACITAINIYHGEPLLPLVVCSRTTEYESATKYHRLTLQGAVVVQPLTHEHVDAYLVRVGKPLIALRRALKQNEALRILSTTPLMLNILILTYQGASIGSLSHKEPLLFQQVWDDYIQRMVERKGNSKRYPLSQTRSWLGWLARQMREHNQTVFYLEHLQPDWLSTSQQGTYAWRAVRLPAIVIGALVSFLVHSYLLGPIDIPSLLQYGILGGLLGWLWYGPIPKKRSQGERHHGWGRRLVTSASIGLIYGLSFGLYFVIVNIISSSLFFTEYHLYYYYQYDYYLYYTLLNWQTDGLSYGVGIGLGSLLLQHLLTQPFHSGTSSGNGAPRLWKRAVRFFQAVQGPRASLVAVVIGLSYGLSVGLGYGLSYLMALRDASDVYYHPSSGQSYALLIGLGFGLSYGLVSLILDAHTTAAHLFEEREAREVGLTCFSANSYIIGNVQQFALNDLS